jgi:hypothetical protein
MKLYHFTGSCNLPRILHSGDLRPMPHNDGIPEFVHATSNPHGEKTASLDAEVGKDSFYQAGVLARVRFTLNAEDFEQWLTIVRRYPQWTPAAVKNLESIGHKLGVSPYSWYARAEALKLDRVVAVHTMTRPDNRWQPFDLSAAEFWTVKDRPNAMGVLISGKLYFSESYVEPDGRTGYRFNKSVPVREAPCPLAICNRRGPRNESD